MVELGVVVDVARQGRLWIVTYCISTTTEDAFSSPPPMRRFCRNGDPEVQGPEVVG
jgi:hypothetical protein